MRTYLNCKPKYVVKEDKRMVICILECHLDLSSHPEYMNMPWNIHCKKFPCITPSGKFTLTRIAKCHKEDIFNAETGKKIAESKAKKAAFETAKKVFKLYADYLYESVNKINATAKVCNYSVLAESQHYDRLISEL